MRKIWDCYRLFSPLGRHVLPLRTITSGLGKRDSGLLFGVEMKSTHTLWLFPPVVLAVFTFANWNGAASAFVKCLFARRRLP